MASGGTMTKRKDGRWQGMIDVPTLTNRRVRKYVYASTRQECRRKLNKLIDEVENNSIINPSKATFEEFAGIWLEIYCSSLSPTTLDGYKRYIYTYASKYIGEAKLTKILPIYIQQMINDFAKTHSEKTCKNLLGVINGILKYAVLNKTLTSNPCKNIKIPHDANKYKYYIYTEHEFNKLLRTVTGTKEEIPILLAGLCGLRVSEIMGLTWNDIDFKNNLIYIRRANVHVNGLVVEKNTKTRTSYREVIAPSYVIERLKIYKSVGLVYPKKDGSPENGGNYSKRFSRLLKKASLPHTRFHDLRHFNATMMLKHGIPDKEAAERLGHSNTNMTKKYQHVLNDMKQKPAEILNDIVEKMDVKMDVK